MYMADFRIVRDGKGTGIKKNNRFESYYFFDPPPPLIGHK